MLASIVQHPGQPPHQRISQLKMSVLLRLRNSPGLPQQEGRREISPHETSHRHKAETGGHRKEGPDH